MGKCLDSSVKYLIDKPIGFLTNVLREANNFASAAQQTTNERNGPTCQTCVRQLLQNTGIYHIKDSRK